MALSAACRGLGSHHLTKVSQQARAAHSGSGSVLWGAELQRPMAPAEIRLLLRSTEQPSVTVQTQGT